jgi:hypothetical protein
MAWQGTLTLTGKTDPLPSPSALALELSTGVFQLTLMPLCYSPCHDEKHQEIRRHLGHGKTISLQCSGIEEGKELANK